MKRLIGLAALVVVTNLAFRHDAEAGTSLSRYKESQLARLGSFAEDKMVDTHLIMNNLFLRLWDSKKRRIMFQYEAETFAPRYPVLELSDVDGDNIPEQFAYHTERGSKENTQEFGFFFDLDRDGKVDYVIFYGGPLMGEGDAFMWWMNYHSIDSNADGLSDHRLFQGSTDLNGNGRVEPEVGLWFIDADFDGLLDRAIYLSKDLERPVRVQAGQLDLSENVMLKDRKVMIGQPIDRPGDALLSDINKALRSNPAK